MEERGTWIKQNIHDQSLHEVESTWKLPISRLAITGVESSLPKEVRFSPSFHVVSLKIQENINKNCL